MVKKLSLILMLVGMATISANAEIIRDSSLGSPLLNIDDDAIVRLYPAALQNFPSRLWLTITGVGTYTIGGAYIGGNMLGISAEYSTSTGNENFDVPAISYWAGTYSPSFSEHLAILSYGVKLSDSMLLGVGIQNTFPDGNYISQTVDSNEKIVSAQKYAGLKSAISPSAVLSLGDKITIFGKIDLKLNLMKYEEFDTYETNKLTISPSTLNELGLRILGAYQLNEKTLVGAAIRFSLENNNYSVETITNTKKEISTNYIGNNPLTIELTLGARVKADEKVTLFFTIPLGISIAEDGHWEGVKNFNYNKTTTWTIPTLSLAGEAEVLKNLFFRLYANPSWIRTVTEPAGYEGTGAPKSITYNNTYGIATGLGLGYQIGRLTIDGTLNAAWFTETIRNPLRRVAEIFNSATSGPTQILTTAQLKYSF
jgi:hypothetical protein